MNKLLSSGVLLLICFGAAAQRSDKAAQLKQLLSSAALPGIQLIYTHDGVSEPYLLGTDGSGRPVTKNTIFEAASLSKCVFAYAVLRLYDRGLIDLDKPLLPIIGTYDKFNPPNPAYGQITARMVLRHTTGLPNWGDSAGARLRFPPDSCFGYSGEGYMFLQRVVEKITGKTLNQLAQDEVFTPLGMTSSSYSWTSRFDSVSAFGSDTNAVKWHSEQMAAASLLTNAHDYTLFLQAVATGKGLKPATHAMMLTKSTPANWFGHKHTEATDHISWGLGVGLQTDDQGQAFWHWGDNGDFKAFYIVFPSTHRSLVYFVHDWRGLFITQEVLDLFFGRHRSWAIRWTENGYENPWAMRDFRTAVEKSGFDKAAAIREQLVQRGDSLSESDLNDYGFIQLTKGKREKLDSAAARVHFAQAIAIFRLNLDLHPQSSNAFDSIAEAYDALGDKQKALENFRRCVELNPRNEYATGQIKALEEGLK